MQLPYTITNHMLNRMADISQIIGRLQVQYERNLRLRKENRIRSIQSSLAIENNTLTLEQVTDIIDGKPVFGDPKEIKEVQNAYAAYEEILTYDPYSVTDFLKAHGLLTKEILHQPGVFRQKDVGIYDASGKLIHMGARPQFVEKLISELFAWAKEDNTPELIKSSVLHYEIEVIHPYEDANGRIGRLWQTIVLSQWNPVFAWLPIETIVYQNQQQYYDVLAQADKNNDSTVFIEFMLDVIWDTVKRYPEDGA